MATPYYGWILPTVGASADAWGGLINDAFNAQDTQLASPANTIKGNNTGSTAASINLTVTQTTAMLNAVTGATQGGAGVKGLVPQPAAAQQNFVLAGDGTFRSGLGRAFGCVIATTNVNGSQPTFANGLNIASLSTLTETGGLVACTVTFTNALPDANYAVHGNTDGLPGSGTTDFAFGARTTTTVVIYWRQSGGNPSRVSISGFV